MSEPHEARPSPGPGAGPDGVPAAIGLSPILSARYRAVDLDRIRAAAPGSRLVSVSREGLADASLDDVEVLLRGWLSTDAFDRLLLRAPRLAWVHSASAGVEHLLTPAGRERGLVFTNARGVFSRPIAEYVMMMILAVCRQLPQLLELQRERTWQPLEGRELSDVTVGVVGYGSIGRTISALARSFGCRVIAVRRHDPAMPVGTAATPGPDGATDAPDGTSGSGPLEVHGTGYLPDLLAAADFVVLALPLLPETERLIDAAALTRMKSTAWLINVARGRLVDERALIAALRAGTIGGAVLDTFQEEPLPPSSPLYSLPTCVVTPHTSWSSGRVLDRSIELFCENLVRYRRGEPLANIVDPAAGY